MIVNGDFFLLESLKEPTILCLLKHFNLSGTNTAVEYNNNIIKKEELPKITLKEEDILELIQFVGGG